MKTAGNTILYTLLNIRYSALILPTGVVAYLAGIPPWMVLVAAVCLILAAAAELFTSVAHGLSTAHQLREQAELIRSLTAGAETYANGGWLDGSEGNEPVREGREDGPEGEAGGQGPVPAR